MKLKWQDDGTFKTPLARAKGLGAARGAVSHWWHQRVTALAAIPLTLWLAWSATAMPGWDYEHMTSWLAQPCNTVLMSLTVLTLFYHAAIGSKVIAEDYIHNEAMKIAKLIGIDLFFTAAAVVCIVSILKISLAG